MKHSLEEFDTKTTFKCIFKRLIFKMLPLAVLSERSLLIIYI